MRERIRRLSPGFEFVMVLLVAFGYTVPVTLAALFSSAFWAVQRASPPITNASLQGIIVYELVICSALAAFLNARGWTLAQLGLRPTIRDTAQGAGIFAGYYLLYWVLAMALASVWPAYTLLAASTHLVGGGLEWPTIVVVSLVNPCFEEIFVCSYVITALKERYGITTAVNVSAAIRLSCHLYQGAVGVVGVAPLALLFAYWFARTGRVWPLIVAHALMDFIALAVSASG